MSPSNKTPGWVIWLGAFVSVTGLVVGIVPDVLEFFSSREKAEDSPSESPESEKRTFPTPSFPSISIDISSGQSSDLEGDNSLELEKSKLDSAVLKLRTMKKNKQIELLVPDDSNYRLIGMRKPNGEDWGFSPTLLVDLLEAGSQNREFFSGNSEVVLIARNQQTKAKIVLTPRSKDEFINLVIDAVNNDEYDGFILDGER